jgi:hypothetical protein
MKTQSQTELAFLLIKKKSVSSFKIGLVQQKDTIYRSLNITKEWERSIQSLNISAPIQQVVLSKQKGKFRMTILDETNTLTTLNREYKHDDFPI